MEVTHGIALAFSVIFVIMATIFKKLLWWVLNIVYILVMSIMAINNEWEALFFAPMVFFAIISIIGLSFCAAKGEII